MDTVQRKHMVIFFGMTASGKSHLSTAWARKCGCRRFNTDVVRKKYIVEPGGRTFAESGIEKGMYSPEMSMKTYDKLLELAEGALADPLVSCVVLDGSFQRAKDRAQLFERFQHTVVPLFILCHCSDQVTRSRLALRHTDSMSVSDGDLEVYLHQLIKFENPTEIPHAQLLELDTDAPLEYLIERLENFLAQSGWIQQNHAGSEKIE